VPPAVAHGGMVGATDCLHNPEHRAAMARPPSLSQLHRADRGFGIELELLTAYEPMRGWSAALAAARASEPAALLKRLERWEPGQDAEVHGAALAIVAPTIAAYAAELAEGGQEPMSAEDHAALGRLLSAYPSAEAKRGAAGSLWERRAAEANGVCVMKQGANETDGDGLAGRADPCWRTEFRSPHPPHELSFGRRMDAHSGSGVHPAGRNAAGTHEEAGKAAGGEAGDTAGGEAGGAAGEEVDGAAEICAFARVLRLAGAAVAPAVTADANASVATHIHVNVCHPRARGDELSARAILGVWLWWVRFDVAIAQLARPWMCCESSCAPLYASGAEFAVGCGVEARWQQGTGIERGGALGDPEAADVPAYIAAVQRELRSDGWADLSMVAQRRRLFGAEEHGGISRFVSLNVHAVTKHGTLEVRRFHTTLNGATLAHWAAFCVGFVEAFRTPERTEAVLRAFVEPPIDMALTALREAQEKATLDELTALMAAHVDASTFAHLRADARGG
jgi:hypothetical protein